MRVRALDQTPDRPEARRCEERGCGRATREGKPFCSRHVDRHPYVQHLQAQLGAQEAEIARVRRQGPSAVDPEGLICQEILDRLQVSGPRTLVRLARNMILEASVIDSYVEVLARLGKVRVTLSKRRGRVVGLPRVGSTDEGQDGIDARTNEGSRPGTHIQPRTNAA